MYAGIFILLFLSVRGDGHLTLVVGLLFLSTSAAILRVP